MSDLFFIIFFYVFVIFYSCLDEESFVCFILFKLIKTFLCLKVQKGCPDDVESLIFHKM